MLPPARFNLRTAEPWLRRYHGWGLAVAWLGMQAFCWCYYQAPRLFGDGLGYLAYARQLAGAGPVMPNADYYQRYAGYAAFLSVFIRLGLGPLGMALGQVGLAGLAMCAFYATIRRLSGGHWPTAALATAALIGWFEVQAFNAFLLTESLFTSLLILSFWAVARVRNARGVGLALGLVLLTASVRPNGFVALAAAGLAGLSWLYWAGRWRTLRWVGLGLLLLAPLAWARLNWLLSSLHVLLSYAAGTVIFNYPAVSLPPPAGAKLLVPAGSALGQLGWFIAHNFRYCAQLAALKLTYFLGFPKPWHSARHVAWAVVVLPTTYWLAGWGVARRAVALPSRVYLAAGLVLQMSIVMLTFEDWDVRFSGPFVPYWLALAAVGGQGLWQRAGRGKRA